MRICISGTANIGKSTLIKDFINKWEIYKTPKTSYRDVIKDKNYPHNKNCNKEGQWAIMNHMIDDLQKYNKTDNILFDRGPLDCLVYSIWAYEKGSSDIDKIFIDKLIPLVKESMKHIDLIFFLPVTKLSPVQIVDNGSRDTDPVFIEEIDNIFKALFFQYQHNLGKTPFFDSEDCPAMVEIFGNPEERIALIQQYLKDDGEVYGEEEDTILNPKSLIEIEKLLKEQEDTHSKEQSYKEQEKLIKEYIKKSKIKI